MSHSDANGAVLPEPLACPTWTGLPIQMSPYPAVLTLRDVCNAHPLVALALSGRGQRWYTNGGRTQSFYTAPGMIELYAGGHGLDRGRWEGEGGHVILVELPAPALRHLLQGDSTLPLNLSTHNEVFDSQLEFVLRAMWTEAGSGAQNGALYAQGLSLAMLGLLEARYAARKVSAIASATLGREQRSRVIDYVEQHLSHDLSVEQMAELAGMSPDRFARAFKATYQVGPHGFVLERRLEVASRMLREQKDLPISEVAALTGFSSQAHFTEMFRRKVGTTPARWRKSLY